VVVPVPQYGASVELTASELPDAAGVAEPTPHASTTSPPGRGDSYDAGSSLRFGRGRSIGAAIATGEGGPSQLPAIGERANVTSSLTFVAAEEARTGLSFTDTQVQSQLAQHGGDFGLQGANNAAGRLDYISRLVDHIDAPGTTQITGTYRGAPAVHYLDPETGLNVFTTPEGGVWGAWQLGPEQVESVMLRGNLR
jgi:hypothetical protein